MNQVSLLREVLRPHLGWHGARLSFLASFLIALLRVRTVNFSELAIGFGGSAQPESHYKRLQRFFREYVLDITEITQAVVVLMNIPEPWVLSIDRTDWQFGKTVFNLLMLGVVHEGVAFPLVWVMLDKKGNSNSLKRSQLFNQFIEAFGDHSVACLTADREFVGGDWFGYLLEEPQTTFRIRIRENHRLNNGRVSLSVKTLFADLKVGETKVLRHKRQLWGHWVYVAALRLADGELLVVATQSTPQSAIRDYAKRWGIETLFGIFKTRGFCLESTHLQDSERLSKLISLLSLALCWAIMTGEWLVAITPITLKKHGRKAKSVFRTGLDYLRHIFLNLEHKHNDFLTVLQFLSCT
jgi:hypothetical protein